MGTGARAKVRQGCSVREIGRGEKGKEDEREIRIRGMMMMRCPGACERQKWNPRLSAAAAKTKNGNVLQTAMRRERRQREIERTSGEMSKLK